MDRRSTAGDKEQAYHLAACRKGKAIACRAKRTVDGQTDSLELSTHKAPGNILKEVNSS